MHSNALFFLLSNGLTSVFVSLVYDERWFLWNVTFWMFSLKAMNVWGKGTLSMVMFHHVIPKLFTASGLKFSTGILVSMAMRECKTFAILSLHSHWITFHARILKFQHEILLFTIFHRYFYSALNSQLAFLCLFYSDLKTEAWIAKVYFYYVFSFVRRFCSFRWLKSRLLLLLQG